MEDDEKMLLNEKIIMDHRKFFALKYRIELKHIIYNQIKLCQIAHIILGRLKAGLDFTNACSKIPELEALEEDVLLDRIMLGKYLSKLKKNIIK